MHLHQLVCCHHSMKGFCNAASLGCVNEHYVQDGMLSFPKSNFIINIRSSIMKFCLQLAVP